MSKHPFVSASAIKVRSVNKTLINIQTEPRIITVTNSVGNVVFWYGKMLEAAKFGELLKFEVRNIKELFVDNSAIIHAKCVVLYYAELNARVIKLINVAVNYGVPVAWWHPHIAPNKWMFSFRVMEVGKENIYEFWKKVCNII